jgi:hypothetical protein
MNKNTNDKEVQLAVELDLEKASNRAFEEAVAALYAWSAEQEPVGPLNKVSGWYRVDPLTAQDFLRRNVCNREPSLATVRRYLYDMQNDNWRKTGQGLVFNTAGKLNEGQQRLWACYFGKVSFETFIVTDAPEDADLFAYYDDVKPRSAADALHTSGLNGVAKHIAVAVQLSHRYEHEALAILKQPKIHRLNNREVLYYSRTHPTLNETAHLILSNYGKAVSVIGDKGVAIFFSDKVISLFGEERLDAFLVPLGSGANLEENSPIIGLRNRLFAEEKINRERILALTIKAFNYFQQGTKLSKRGLYVADNEKFPRLEALVQQTGNAVE